MLNTRLFLGMLKQHVQDHSLLDTLTRTRPGVLNKTYKITSSVRTPIGYLKNRTSRTLSGMLNKTYKITSLVTTAIVYLKNKTSRT